jgi:hypothetical protein
VVGSHDVLLGVDAAGDAVLSAVDVVVAAAVVCTRAECATPEVVAATVSVSVASVSTAAAALAVAVVAAEALRALVLELDDVAALWRAEWAVPVPEPVPVSA